MVTAKDGVDALEQLFDLVPTAMLVDIEMPRMDGFERRATCAATRARREVAVIMITPRASPTNIATTRWRSG